VDLRVKKKYFNIECRKIDYGRLNIEYLWYAVDLKQTERSDTVNLQFSIFNRQLSASGGSGPGGNNGKR
jgi:hypothetical protein